MTAKDINQIHNLLKQIAPETDSARINKITNDLISLALTHSD